MKLISKVAFALGLAVLDASLDFNHFSLLLIKISFFIRKTLLSIRKELLRLFAKVFSLVVPLFTRFLLP